MEQMLLNFRLFTPDTMTINSNKKYFKIKQGLWKGYNLWDLYNKGSNTPKMAQRTF